LSLLDQLIPDKDHSPTIRKPLSACLNKLARLGGYLGRNSDPPPGNIVIWRGLSRLANIRLGATPAPISCE
jgi:hypothetical protein